MERRGRKRSFANSQTVLTVTRWGGCQLSTNQKRGKIIAIKRTSATLPHLRRHLLSRTTSTSIPPSAIACHPPVYFSSPAGTTRCCGRVWLVRLGGRPSRSPVPVEPFPSRLNDRPRSSSLSACQELPRRRIGGFIWANTVKDGKKVSIEGTGTRIESMAECSILTRRSGVRPHSGMREGRKYCS